MAGPRHSRLIVAHGLLAVFLTTLPAQGQTASRSSQSGARVLEFGEHVLQQTRRIAVVGDVERPGVYESTGRPVDATAVLSAAGSLGGEGGSFWRYHRGLHPVSSPTWNSDSVPVADGDVLVVTISPQRRKPAMNDAVHVALIGLSADPVVVRVPSSDRSLTSFFSRLHQSSLAAAAATVNGRRSSGLLENGDVVTVSSHLLDRTISFGPDLIVPVRQLAALASLQPTTDWTSTFAADSSPVLPLNAPPLEEAVSMAQSHPTLPQQQESASTEVAADQTESLRSTPGESLVESARTATGVAQRHQRAFGLRSSRQSVSDAREEDFSRSMDAGTIRLMVLMLAIGTLGIGVLLLWMATEGKLRIAAVRQPAPPRPVPPAAAAPTDSDDFDDLIRGTLPVEDEPVVLPSRLALHGEAVGQKRLIVHPPQELAGPHFGRAAAPAGKTAARGQAQAAVGQASRSVSSSPVRSSKDTEGLLDRVLLAMQREEKR